MKINKLSYIFLATICLFTTSCGRKSIEDQLVEQAIEFTQKQCPREVDQFTTIDSMTFDKETRTLHYYYTLKDRLDDPKSLTESVVEDFRENMLIKLRDDLGLKKEKEEKLGFSYHYLSQKTGEELLTLAYTHKDYTGKINVHTFNYREVRNLREFTRTQCPIRQDNYTVLDSMWYDSIARTFYYDYSLNGELDADTLYNDFDEQYGRLKKELIASLKTNNEIEIERDKEHLNFSFRYFSSTTKKKYLEIMIKNKEIK